MSEVPLQGLGFKVLESRRGVLLPPSRFYLTECIHQLVLENHPPLKTVTLLFTLTDLNIKLTTLWGS